MPSPGSFTPGGAPGVGSLFLIDLIGWLRGLLGIPVSWQVIPQATGDDAEPRLPCVVVTRTGNDPIKGVKGSTSATKLTFSFDVEASTSLECEMYGETLRLLLDNYIGDIGNSVVNWVSHQNSFDKFELEIDASDRKTWIQTHVFLFCLDVPIGNPPI